MAIKTIKRVSVPNLKSFGQEKTELRAKEVGKFSIMLIWENRLVHIPNFGGLSGSEDRGGGDNSIQFINFGKVGDKGFEEWRQKRVGDDNILTFSSYCTR